MIVMSKTPDKMSLHLNLTTFLLYSLIKIYAAMATTTAAVTTPSEEAVIEMMTTSTTTMTTTTTAAVENTTSGWSENTTESDLYRNTTSDWSENSTSSDWSENTSTYDWLHNTTSDWSESYTTSDWSDNTISDWSGKSTTPDLSGNHTTSHWSENTTTFDWSGNTTAFDWSEYTTTSDWSENKTSDWSGNKTSDWSENITTSDWPETTTSGWSGSITPDMLGNFTGGWSGETTGDWSSNATSDWSERSIYNNTFGWFRPNTSETSGNATAIWSDKDSMGVLDTSKSTGSDADNMIHTELDLTASIEGQAVRDMNYSLTIPEMIYTADYNKSDISSNSMISSFLENIHPSNNYTNTQRDVMQTTAGDSVRSKTSPSFNTSVNTSTSSVLTGTQQNMTSSGDDVSGARDQSSRLISDVTTPSGVRSEAGVPSLPPMTTEFFAVTISFNRSLPESVTTSQMTGSDSDVSGSVDSSVSASDVTSQKIPMTSSTLPPSIPNVTSTTSSSSSSSQHGEMTSSGQQQQQRPSVLLEVIRRPVLSRNGYLGYNSVTGGSRLRKNRLLNSFQRDRPVPPGLRRIVGRLQSQKSWQNHHNRHDILAKNYHSNRIVEIVSPPLPPHLTTNHRPSPPNHHPLRPSSHRKHKNAPDVVVTSGPVPNEADDDDERPRQLSSKTSPVSRQKQDNIKTLPVSTNPKAKSVTSVLQRKGPLTTLTTKKIGIPQLVITVGGHVGLGKLAGVLKVAPRRHVRPESSRRRFYLRRFGRPRPWSSKGSLSRLRVIVG